MEWQLNGPQIAAVQGKNGTKQGQEMKGLKGSYHEAD